MSKEIFLVVATIIAGCVLIPTLGWGEGLSSVAGITVTLAFMFYKK